MQTEQGKADQKQMKYWIKKGIHAYIRSTITCNDPDCKSCPTAIKDQIDLFNKEFEKVNL